MTTHSAQIPHFRPEIDDADVEAVTTALRARRLSQGDETKRLEEAVADRLGGEAVAVSSGTAALYLSLLALDVPEGARVVVPSYTCNSLYAAVSYAGAVAVCADVPARGVSPDAETVKPLLGPGTGAVIAPHTCGYLAGCKAIAGLGVPLIEDCAHAVGGRYPDGGAVGTRGDVAVFSLYATKLISSGEGGICFTRRPELAAAVRRLRECDEQPLHRRAFNFKLSDISAALALSRWKRLPREIETRQRLADRYDDVFGPLSCRRVFTQQQAVCFRYLVRARQGAPEFARAAQAAGICCRRPVFRPLHETLGGVCPETDDRFRHIVSIPLYPGLTPAQTERILAVLPPLLG